MNESEKKKLIGANAAIWAGATLISVIATYVTESAYEEGRGEFLKLMAHAFPMFIGLALSTAILGKVLAPGSGEKPE